MIPIPETKPSSRLAFPNSATFAPGMTYRQWLVGMALQGLLAGQLEHLSAWATRCGDSVEQCVANAATSYADAVLSELEK
jgi:hypothetical protein